MSNMIDAMTLARAVYWEQTINGEPIHREDQRHPLVCVPAIAEEIDAARLAGALAMREKCAPIVKANPVTIGPNTASYPSDGSYSEFKPPDRCFDDPTQAARVAYWFKSWDECVAFDAAIRAIRSTAPEDA